MLSSSLGPVTPHSSPTPASLAPQPGPRFHLPGRQAHRSWLADTRPEYSHTELSCVSSPTPHPGPQPTTAPALNSLPLGGQDLTIRVLDGLFQEDSGPSLLSSGFSPLSITLRISPPALSSPDTLPLAQGRALSPASALLLHPAVCLLSESRHPSSSQVGLLGPNQAPVISGPVFFGAVPSPLPLLHSCLLMLYEAPT